MEVLIGYVLGVSASVLAAKVCSRVQRSRAARRREAAASGRRASYLATLRPATGADDAVALLSAYEDACCVLGFGSAVAAPETSWDHARVTALRREVATRMGIDEQQIEEATG